MRDRTGMKWCLIGVLGASSFASAQQWNLIWSDEFDGTTLDTNSWSYQTGTGTAYGLPAGWGNNELQYYTNFSSNVAVSGGTLKIIARQQNFAGSPYTSGRIRTVGLRDFVYGRFESRMKIPSTSGVWPAFWMLPTDSPYGGWASSGEIDIMESVNIANTVHGTIHYGSPWPNNQSNGGSVNNGTDFSQDFHEYAIEWGPDEMRWYLDGDLFHSVTSSQWFSSVARSNPRAPFDVPFHLLLNVAVGGNWPGNPNGSATFPQTLEVDYVRVFEQVQAPYGGTPHEVPGMIQAEDYDLGSNGQAYFDCDAPNNGGAYRQDAVDIQTATEGNFNIGWMCENEWLEYTIDVAASGTYRVDARVASLVTGGSFRLEVDSQDLTGPIAVPVTNGWQSWHTVTENLDLDAGTQIIRFVNLGGPSQAYNLNWFTFAAIGGCSIADTVEPFGVLDFFDVSEFLSRFAASDPAADLVDDGVLDFFDVAAFLTAFAMGCP